MTGATPLNTPPATDRGLSEAVERLKLWLKTCEADNMVEAYGFDLSHTLNRDISALLAAARREGEGGIASRDHDHSTDTSGADGASAD